MALFKKWKARKRVSKALKKYIRGNPSGKRWWVMSGPGFQSSGPFLKQSTAREAAQSLADKHYYAVEYQQLDSSGRKLGYPRNVQPKRSSSNPHVKLPTQWTPGHVRVDQHGNVQIKVNPGKLKGTGKFARCVKSVEAKGGAAA